MTIIQKINIKISILMWTLIGELIKLYVYMFSFPKCKSLGGQYEGKNVIATLTTYGRRQEDVVQYTLYSLFRQTIMPTKIILVVDENTVMSPALNYFISRGLTIIYDKDKLRSYKKLIPVLDLCKDDLIITFDDDFYYRSRTIENLLKSYSKNHDAIHVNCAKEIVLKTDGTLEKYNNWIAEELVKNPKRGYIFPTGGAGTLYQSRLLHSDISNQILFKKLCPIADDVWFYFMAKLLHTEYCITESQNHYMIPIDNVYQLTHKGSRLADTNCGENANDIQIENVLKYYNLNINELIYD